MIVVLPELSLTVRLIMLALVGLYAQLRTLPWKLIVPPHADPDPLQLPLANIAVATF